MNTRIRIFGVIALSATIVGGSYFYKSMASSKPNTIANNITSIKQSDVLIDLSYEELSEMSDVVVIGEIQNVQESKWNNDENKKPDNIRTADIIYTDSKIKVKEVLKGDESLKDVTVRFFGGNVEGFEFYTDSDPTPSKGKQVMLFLREDKTEYNKKKTKGHYILSNGIQGYFEIDGSKIKSIKEGIVDYDPFIEKIKSKIKVKK